MLNIVIIYPMVHTLITLSTVKSCYILIFTRKKQIICITIQIYNNLTYYTLINYINVIWYFFIFTPLYSSV